MRPRVTSPSWFERNGRAVKADKLVSAVHDMRKRLGISESAMLESVSHWPPLWWAQLAVLAGTQPPSDATKDAVLATLARSALVERLVTDAEPYFSADRDARVTT